MMVLTEPCPRFSKTRRPLEADPIETPYLYQEHQRYFAQVAHPIEELAGEELAELGAYDIEPGYRGVHFRADPLTLYTIVYQARIPTRVIAPLVTFDCHSDKYLYKRAQEVDWLSLIGPERTFAIFASVSASHITHSKYAALRLKDAIVDQIRDHVGSRPDVDRREPDVSINLHIENNRATISLDAAGQSMHRRGYRLDAMEAPLQETVAAAIVRMSEWKADRPFLDPMCGSGTILAEALMMATGTPAGYLHQKFGFEQFPDFDLWAWSARRKEIDDAIKPIEKGLISGSDLDSEALRMARKNLSRLPHGDLVTLTKADYRNLDDFENGVLVTNPPYGVRLNGGMPIEAFYKELGDFFKQKCAGTTAYVYVGKPELLKTVGLRT
ncbi:MAG: class I SAM-dependent RNA methyltransferase, partial [Cryomorphaceae bacterium]|nr:class I SAM-dependent RNA methyltransferase [Cryomorphaceae bacterium]